MKNKTIKAVIFGASGMVGRAVLHESLEDEHVEKVLCIGRSTPEIEHPRLSAIILKDFEKLNELADKVKGFNTCFYAVGIPSAGISEEQYKRVTCDYTLNAADMLLKHNHDLTFCFVSAAGANSSEKGRYMWTRIKGKTENELQTYPFKSIYCFRPAFIQPMKKVRSQVRRYRLFYLFFKPLFFLFKFFPSIACSSVELGKAMINAAYYGSDKVILESIDIVKLGRMKMHGKIPHKSDK